MSLKHYLIEIFEPTILYSFFAGVLGLVIALHYGASGLISGILAVLGVVLAQIAVNLLDDYVDYTSGLDKETEPTNFSGGSALVIKGLVKVKHVLWIGLACLILGSAIGIYLIAKDLLLLPFFIVGFVSVIFYAKYLVKIPLVAEPITAISFIFICLATFLVSGGLPSELWLVAFAAVPCGIQASLALFVNEIPDRQVDAKFGRKNTAILARTNLGAAAYYLLLNSIAYISVISGFLLGILPFSTIFVLLTAPLVWCISRSIVRYNDTKKFVRTMANGALIEIAIMTILVLAFL